MSEVKLGLRDVKRLFGSSTHEALKKGWGSDDLALSLEEIDLSKVPAAIMPDIAKAFGCEALKSAAKRFGDLPPINCEAPEATAETAEEHKLPEPFRNIVGKEALESLLAGEKGNTVVMLVWSRNCGHCTAQKPEFIQAVTTELAGKAGFVAAEFPYPMRINPYASFTGGEKYVTRPELEGLLPNTFVLEDLGVKSFPSLVIFRRDAQTGEWTHEVRGTTKETTLAAVARDALR